MPTITSKGYKLPSVGERGTWWQNIIDNFIRVNNHNHDDVNSAKISTKDLLKTTQDILAANWVATADGTYKQNVTMPAGYTFPSLSVKFLVSGGAEDGVEVFLTIKKTDTNKFDLFINDNTVDLKAIYA